MTQPGKIVATVWSGLCNRLFVIASALRLAEASSRDLHVFWLARTGRAALEYEGNEDAVFEDLFDTPIEGLASVTHVAAPPQLPADAVGLDFSAGYELPIGRGMQVPPEVVAMLTSPRILNLDDPDVAAAGEVWIHLSTLPVGGVEDQMEAHVNYFLPPGMHRKDRFFKSLSDYAQRIRPRADIRAEVDGIVTGMREKAAGAPLVGIHIRGSDREQRTDVRRQTALKQIIANLLRNPDRHTQIFLASDDQGEIDLVLEHLPDEEFADSIIGAGPILRVLNKLKKTAVLMHYKMPGGYSRTFYTKRLRPEVQPFGKPLLAKTVSLLYNFH